MKLFNMLIFLLLTFSCSIEDLLAQYDNVWAFGYGAGVDFNYDPPRPIKTSISTSEGCAVICDDDGNLLFYTDGTTIWDKNHSPMPTGVNVHGQTANLTQSTTQGALAVPFPGSNHKYYVFSMGSNRTVLGDLYYSIVDMNLNNGLGDVLPTRKGINLGNRYTEHMCAVAGNNCDIWLVVVDRIDDKFYAYNIDFNGINLTPVISDRIPDSRMPFSGIHGGVIGSIDFSPDRLKLAISQGNFVVYEFNPDFGTVSNPMIIDMYGYQDYYGVSFSHDGTKLYGGTSNNIFQFDLSSSNLDSITGSKISLAENIGYAAIKRASDGKIYCSRGRALHRINKPNSPGLSCQFEKDGLKLIEGTIADFGLPNIAVIKVNKKIYNSSTITSCDSEIILSANDSSGINYIWNNGKTDRFINVDSSATYWVSYQISSSHCLSIVDTFHVTLKQFSTNLHINPVCKDHLNGAVYHKPDLYDNNYYAYQWSSKLDTIILSTDSFLSNVGLGEYQVYISSSNGCDTVLTFYIPREDYRVYFESDTLICEGDLVSFFNRSNNHFDEWRWDFGNGDTSSLYQPQNVYRVPGTYRVMLSGIGKVCSDTTYQTINVDARVDTLMFLASPSSVCQGEAILFTPFTDTSVLNLYWDFGYKTDFSSSLQELRHAYDISGMMYVHLTARFRACPDLTYGDSIMVYDFPKVDLGPDSLLCYQGKPITLKNVYDHQEGYVYLWSTGSSEASIDVVHHGDFSLTATNEQGCSVTEWVHISKDCYVDIPNSFTPNGDGLNDYFFPRFLLSKGVIRLHMQVLNRWGKVVFETNNVGGRGWDGRYNHEDQPQGVYVYFIEVEFYNGASEKFDGNLTLLR